MRSYYEILGVPRRASTDEITVAYCRRLAQFPPINLLTTRQVEQARALNTIHHILGEPQRRTSYNNILKSMEDYERTSEASFRLLNQPHTKP